MIVGQDHVVNRIPTQARGANHVRELRCVIGRAGIDDRRLFASDQNVAVDETQIDPKGFGWAQVLSVGDPDREIAASDGDTPSAAPEAEIEFIPYCETPQDDL